MFSHVYSRFIALCLLMALSSLALPSPVLADEPLWIDVRSASEYSEGHVEQAVNITYKEIAEHITTVTTDKDAAIYVYCRSGRRSGIAQETLENMGYTDVVNVGGLGDALKKAGQEAGQEASH